MDDEGNYIDPMEGVQDLKHGFLEYCNKDVFYFDPIRIIRYFRFKHRFNLWSAESCIHLGVEVFSQVSDNRIKDELFKCFKDPVVGCKVVCDLKANVPEICDYIFSKFKLRASLK